MSMQYGIIREREILNLLKESEPVEQQPETTIKKDDKSKKGPPAKQVKGVDE